MEEQPTNNPPELAARIARLVEERGWNQEEFARIARVNRHTARQILLRVGGRSFPQLHHSRLRPALGLSVNDLRSLPLEKLLPLMRDAQPADGEAGVRGLYEQATQPELVAWLERNPDRAHRLSAEERHELLALQGSAGPLRAFGVEGFVQRLERRRRIVERIHAIAGTEYLDLLEQFVDLLHDKVQPGRDRP